MKLRKKKRGSFTHYGVALQSPTESEPALIMALNYEASPGQWRVPANRKEALWVIHNNIALSDNVGWTAELIEFKPGKRWSFAPRSVKDVYPHLEWSEEDGKYIDPTKIAPEAAGWTQEEADAGHKHD